MQYESLEVFLARRPVTFRLGFAKTEGDSWLTMRAAGIRCGAFTTG
jgi:hypothetical protein